MAKTRIEVKQTTRTTQRTHLHRHYLHVYKQHVVVNMVGAIHWCSVVLMLGHRSHWRHRFGVSWRRVTRLRLFPVMIPCLIFQINNFASLGAIITQFISLFSVLNKLSGDIYHMSVRPQLKKIGICSGIFITTR